MTVLKLKKIIKLTNILHLNQEIFTKEDQNKGKTRVYCFLALQKENVMCSSINNYFHLFLWLMKINNENWTWEHKHIPNLWLLLK